jgi:Fe-S-cluster containining protein
MNLLIKEWKQKKGSKQKETNRFIRKLKQHKGKRLDAFAEEVHEEVFSKLSCLDCANCCTSIPPIVNRTDTARIAKHLGMKVSEFQQKYLTVDEDGDTVMNQTPCPFLQEDHHCMIYEVRPKACRKYPHTDAQQFSAEMKLHAQNAFYCPAVFHILEAMKQRVPV